MDYDEAVGVLKDYMDTAPQSRRVAAAVRAVLDSPPAEDRLAKAEATIERAWDLVDSYSLIEAEQLRAALEGRDEEA